MGSIEKRKKSNQSTESGLVKKTKLQKVPCLKPKKLPGNSFKTSPLFVTGVSEVIKTSDWKTEASKPVIDSVTAFGTAKEIPFLWECQELTENDCNPKDIDEFIEMCDAIGDYGYYESQFNQYEDYDTDLANSGSSL